MIGSGRTRRMVVRRTLGITLATVIGASLIAQAPASANAGPVTETSTGSSLSAGSTATTTVTAPPAPAGAVTASLAQEFDPQRLQLSSPSDVKAPTGWSVEYSTDGTTFSSTAPTPLSSVRAVRTIGGVTSAGISNGLQLASKTTAISGSAVVVPPVLASAGTGDGWMPIFTGGSARVFNLHHHLAPGASTFDCHTLATGAYCPGFPFITQMNVQQRAVAMVVNNKLWTPGYNFPARNAGFWCYSLAPVATGGVPTPCAVPWVALSTRVAPGAQPGDVWDIFNSFIPATGGDINYGVPTDTKLFGIDKLTGNLLCLDTARAARCVGQPTDGWSIGLRAGTWPFTTANSFSSLQVWGDRVYALTGGAGPWSTMTCRLVSNPATLCPGWTGTISLADSAILIRLPDATGAVVGVCRATFKSPDLCWDAAGSTYTAPTSLNYRSTSVIADAARMTNSLPVTRGSRIYWQAISPKSPNLRCWDAALNGGLGGQCTLANPAGYSFGAYAAAPHPSFPDCVIGAQDTQPTLVTIDVRNGVFGCDKAIPSVVTMPTASILPPLGCDSVTAMSTSRWKSYAIAGMDQPFTTALLSVKDANGAYVTSSGKLWREVPFPANGVIDLSTLLPADSGPTPTFTVDFFGVPNGKSMKAVGTLIVEGPPPALCLTLTAVATCPTSLSGQTPGAEPRNEVVVTGSGAATTATGVVDPFSSATTTISIEALPVAGCIGTLKGRATVDGTSLPVANASVQLLDATGQPATDANGKPLTTTTDANGNYSFPNLVPGSYKAVFGNTPLYDAMPAGIAGVAATVPAGGTGIANGPYQSPPPGALTGTATEVGTGTPLAGVPVSLLDAQGKPVVGPDGAPLTATTGPDGAYAFPTLPPGTYRVAFGAAPGETPTAATAAGIPATVPSGGSAVANGLFSPPPPGSIIGGATLSGTATVAGTTTPLPGATVSLLDATGRPVLDPSGKPITTTTAANGTYSFPNVPPGDYRVGFSSTPNANVTPETSQVPVTVPSGGQAVADGVYVTPVGTLEGTATLEGTTTPVPGAKVRLLNPDGTPVLDADGAPVSATTDAAGHYAFPDLLPGPYSVRFDDTDTARAIGSARTGVSATVPPNGTGIADGAYVIPPKGTITGTAYVDGTSQPLPGVPVSLLDAEGNPVLDPDGKPLLAITKPDGSYAFTDLPPGDYQVAFGAAPSGTLTPPSKPGVPVTVPADGSAIANGPYAPPRGDLIGTAYVAGTTTPVAGATVRLLDPQGNPVLGPNGLPLTAVTDALGGFAFPNLPAGDYLVDYSPAGQFSPLAGAAAGVRATVPVNGTGSVAAPYRAPVGALRGTAFLDGTTTPVAGASVLLLDGNGKPVLDAKGDPISAVTGPDGTYAFPDLAPGAYAVAFGSTPDASPTGAARTPVPANVVAGATAIADGPYVRTTPGALRGIAYLDGTTTPVPGAKVRLLDPSGEPVLDADGKPLIATTDADGRYRFDDLPPGAYLVQFSSTSDATVIGAAGTGLAALVPAGGVAVVDGPYELVPPPEKPKPAVKPFTVLVPLKPASKPVTIDPLPVAPDQPPALAPVPDSIVIVDPGSGAWSHEVAQPAGTWTVDESKVIFTPAAPLTEPTSVVIAVQDKIGTWFIREVFVAPGPKKSAKPGKPKPTGDVPSVIKGGKVRTSKAH